jgi:hypothetical protein
MVCRIETKDDIRRDGLFELLVEVARDWSGRSEPAVSVLQSLPGLWSHCTFEDLVGTAVHNNREVRALARERLRISKDVRLGDALPILDEFESEIRGWERMDAARPTTPPNPEGGDYQSFDEFAELHLEPIRRRLSDLRLVPPATPSFLKG